MINRRGKKFCNIGPWFKPATPPKTKCNEPGTESELGVVSRQTGSRDGGQFSTSAGRILVPRQRPSGGRNVQHRHGATAARKRRRTRCRLRLPVAVGRRKRRWTSASLKRSQKISHLDLDKVLMPRQLYYQSYKNR